MYLGLRVIVRIQFLFRTLLIQKKEESTEISEVRLNRVGISVLGGSRMENPFQQLIL